MSDGRYVSHQTISGNCLPMEAKTIEEVRHKHLQRHRIGDVREVNHHHADGDLYDHRAETRVELHLCGAEK